MGSEMCIRDRLAIVLALLLRRLTPAWLLALLPFGRRRAAAAAAAAPQLEDALYSDFLQLVERGQVDRVVLSADSLMFSTKAGIGYLTDRFSDETLLPMLHAHKVKFGAAKKGVRRFGPYLVLLLPFRCGKRRAAEASWEADGKPRVRAALITLYARMEA